MAGMIPLSDASRRPDRLPVVTTGIIIVNVLVFVLELAGGDEFVKQWSLVPADIVAGRHWITILTAMFMHGGFVHILGNMVFLCGTSAWTGERRGGPPHRVVLQSPSWIPESP
jgi:membrane associated rhomboid family serine protease